MTARDELVAAIAGSSLAAPVVRRIAAERADRLLDAYRAEVLLEAADFVDNTDTCRCGGCDTCVLRKYAAELRRMAAPTTTKE